MGWEKIDDDTDPPAAAGCYAAFVGDRLVYIGSSANLRSRLKFQRGNLAILAGVKRISFLKVRVYQRAGEFLAAEYRLISRLHPPMNKKHSLPPRPARRRVADDRRKHPRSPLVTRLLAIEIGSAITAPAEQRSTLSGLVNRWGKATGRRFKMRRLLRRDGTVRQVRIERTA